MFFTCSQIAMISAAAFSLSACTGPVTFQTPVMTPQGYGLILQEVTLTKPAAHSAQVDVFYTFGPNHAPNLRDRTSD
jgi:hypothetical protein